MKKNILIYIAILFFYLSTILQSQSQEWELSGWATPSAERSFVRIRCADSLNCMIWGDIELGWGHFFRGTINGQNWYNVYLDSSYQDNEKKFHMITQINAVEYPSTKLFIAVGDSGYVLKTTDRGNTWHKRHIYWSRTFLDLRMLNDNYGIAISQVYGMEKTDMLSTSNAGETWIIMNRPDEFSYSNFIDYQILDSGLVVALINRPGKDNELLWIHGDWEKYEIYPASNNCWNIFFLNENKGWMCGGTKINDLNATQLIVHTEDGGKSWETQRDVKVNGYRLRDIKFYNDSLGMAAGGFATVVSTWNGGKTWRLDTIRKLKENGGNPCIVGSVQMPSITNAYVIAEARYIYKYTRDWALGMEDEGTESGQISLDQNRPNPATNKTEISYTLSNYSHVRLNIYDMLGNIRQALIDEYESPGEHSIIFTTEGLPQGTYFYRLETEKGSVAKQMLILR